MNRPLRRILAISVCCILTVFLMATLFLGRRMYEFQNDEFRKNTVFAVSHLSALGELYMLPHTQEVGEKFEAEACGYAEENRSNIWICDPMGNIVFACDEKGTIQNVPVSAAQLRPKIMPYLQDGFSNLELKGTDAFDDYLIYDCITFGYPIGLDGMDGACIGVALMHMPVPDFYPQIRSMILTAAAACISVLVFTIGLMLYLRYRYAYLSEGLRLLDQKKPLRMMKETIHGQDESARALLRLERRIDQQEASEVAFVANASHELRSPMTSIQGFAQGMLDGIIAEDEYPHYLSVIIQESRRLNALIQDLLDLSRIESQLTPKSFIRFEMHERIRQLLIRFETQIEDKEIIPQIEFATQEAYVIGDPDRLDQVMINLIDNAIKYTPQGGNIRIWSYPTLEDKLMVGVSDTGYGIAQEDIPYIFDRFYKADTSHSSHTGTGLGLAIVKQILEKHDTQVSVHSVPGRGTTFSFFLQRADEKLQESKQ